MDFIYSTDSLSDQLDQFKALSSRVGIPLPEPIIQMFNSGLVRNDTHQGELLADQLLMNWICAEDANSLVDTWLSAELQHGKRFLPFAITGPEAVYCLVALPSGEQGVAYIYNNDERVSIDNLTFPDFIYSWLLAIFSDFRLIDWDEISNPAPQVEDLKGTIEQLKGILESYQYEKLRELVQREPQERTLAYKHHPEQTVSLITLDEQKALLLNVGLTEPVEFEIIMACDCFEAPPTDP